VRSATGAVLDEFGESIAAIEVGGGGPSSVASAGGGTATCLGLEGKTFAGIAGATCAGASAFRSGFDFFFPDLLDLLERLRASCSLCAANSRSRSSSSLVFLRPLSELAVSLAPSDWS
jgi:hypothetical protein